MSEETLLTFLSVVRLMGLAARLGHAPTKLRKSLLESMEKRLDIRTF